MGALSSIMDIGHSLGPLITGLIIGYTLSYQPGFMAGLALALVTAVFFILSVIKIGKIRDIVTVTVRAINFMVSRFSPRSPGKLSGTSPSPFNRI